ncbi:hypothetical protein D3C85_965680 [compost metagenome]
MGRQCGLGSIVLRFQGGDPLQISQGAGRLAHPLIGRGAAVKGVSVLGPRAESTGEGQDRFKVIFLDLGQAPLRVEQDRVIRIGGIASRDIDTGLFQIILGQIG